MIKAIGIKKHFKSFIKCILNCIQLKQRVKNKTIKPLVEVFVVIHKLA